MERKVHITAISLLRLPGQRSIEEHMRLAEQAVDRALEVRPDIILLPEVYPVFESDRAEILRSAKLYDKLNARMAEKATMGNCYIINNILEKRGAEIFNTAFLLDRQGKVCFRYEKTHLAAFESRLYGNRAGNELPVFKTDFGTIGIMICMDVHFPEVARVLALKGAEIIFWPTQAFGPTGEILITLLRARAFDNQVYCVSSNFCAQPYLPGKSMGRACVIGPDGTILADTGNRPGIARAEIDLNASHLLDWSYTDCPEEMERLFPDWKTSLNSLRRPELYTEITKNKVEND
ncbi:MAG: carbon-nitrogen hydrolase family protein [Saccharofermentanales bacterium]|jgi:predicted amidohydrolase